MPHASRTPRSKNVVQKNLCLELRQRARMKETLVIFTIKAVYALTLDAEEAA